MGRNNPKNIKIHNNKLHQKIAKQKEKERVRKEKIKSIAQKYNSTQANLEGLQVDNN
jgi:sRNA-binding carbon storage regulator CsrA